MQNQICSYTAFQNYNLRHCPSLTFHKILQHLLHWTIEHNTTTLPNLDGIQRTIKSSTINKVLGAPKGYHRPLHDLRTHFFHHLLLPPTFHLLWTPSSPTTWKNQLAPCCCLHLLNRTKVMIQTTNPRKNNVQRNHIRNRGDDRTLRTSTKPPTSGMTTLVTSHAISTGTKN